MDESLPFAVGRARAFSDGIIDSVCDEICEAVSVVPVGEGIGSCTAISGVCSFSAVVAIRVLHGLSDYGAKH